MNIVKVANTVKGVYNAIMDPKFWKDANGAEWFVDSLGTNRWYFLRCTDGEYFQKVPFSKSYSSYISAYAALYVWAKSRNMIEIDMFKDFSDVLESFFATDGKLEAAKEIA